MMEAVFSHVPREQVFARTGTPLMPVNALYQMMSLVEGRSPQLAAAATFLTVPDLLNCWLTGARVCEFTNATATQMFDRTSGGWVSELPQPLSAVEATVIGKPLVQLITLGEIGALSEAQASVAGMAEPEQYQP